MKRWSQAIRYAHKIWATPVRKLTFDQAVIMMDRVNKQALRDLGFL